MKKHSSLIRRWVHMGLDKNFLGILNSNSLESQGIIFKVEELVSRKNIVSTIPLKWSASLKMTPLFFYCKLAVNFVISFPTEKTKVFGKSGIKRGVIFQYAVPL